MVNKKFEWAKAYEIYRKNSEDLPDAIKSRLSFGDLVTIFELMVVPSLGAYNEKQAEWRRQMVRYMIGADLSFRQDLLEGNIGEGFLDQVGIHAAPSPDGIDFGIVEDIKQ